MNKISSLERYGIQANGKQSMNDDGYPENPPHDAVPLENPLVPPVLHKWFGQLPARQAAAGEEHEQPGDDIDDAQHKDDVWRPLDPEYLHQTSPAL
jgi:hypothetical protein